METPDKNAHLSPLLSNIKDYGPVDEAPAGEPGRAEEASSKGGLAHEQDRTAVQEPSPARAGDGARWAMYGLVVLWLITLGVGFGAFVWQQTRIDQMVSEREAERRTAQRSIAAAEREAARLSARVQALEAERAGLPAPQATNPSGASSGEFAEDRPSQAAASTAPDVGQVDAEIMPGRDAEQATGPETRRIAESQTVVDVGPGESEANTQGGSDPAADDDAEHPSSTLESVVPPEPIAGGWFVNLSTFSTEALARQWLAQLPGPPADASVIPVQSNGRQLYRVRIGGFESRSEALSAADRMSADWKIEGAWISGK